MRHQHIQFILNDLRERGETATTNIRFFGLIYHLSVRVDGAKRSKKVVYSAAGNVLNGYRAISV